MPPHPPFHRVLDQTQVLSLQSRDCQLSYHFSPTPGFLTKHLRGKNVFLEAKMSTPYDSGNTLSILWERDNWRRNTIQEGKSKVQKTNTEQSSASLGILSGLKVDHVTWMLCWYDFHPFPYILISPSVTFGCQMSPKDHVLKTVLTVSLLMT